MEKPRSERHSSPITGERRGFGGAMAQALAKPAPGWR